MEFNNFPIDIYDIIVIDPPWTYGKFQNSSFLHKKREKKLWPYSTMNIDDIKSLPIKSISHENSFLFLWTTQKYIFQCLDIIKEWGFNYELSMVWKKTFGISNGVPLKGFKFNCEFIIVCSKTKIKPLCQKGIKLIPACFDAPNIGHSVKPDIFYKMIEHLGEKRIDLFARKPREGWQVWGDEVCNLGV